MRDVTAKDLDLNWVINKSVCLVDYIKFQEKLDAEVTNLSITDPVHADFILW